MSERTWGFKSPLRHFSYKSWSERFVFGGRGFVVSLTEQPQACDLVFRGVLEVGVGRFPSMLVERESPGQRAAARLGVSFANALLMPDGGARCGTDGGCLAPVRPELVVELFDVEV